MTNNNNDNELFVSTIDVNRYLPRCEMKGVIEIDSNGEQWSGSCRNAAIYDISVRPANSKRYAVTKSCKEHLEETKRQMLELKIDDD